MLVYLQKYAASLGLAASVPVVDAGRCLTGSELVYMRSIKTPQRVVEWFAGRSLAKKLVSDSLLIDPLSFKITYAKEGHPKIHPFPNLGKKVKCGISISHGGGLAVAAFTETGCVGVDVESDKWISDSMAGSFLSEFEIQEFSKSDRIILWCIKESFLKYLKKGITEDLKKIKIIAFDGNGFKIDYLSTSYQGSYARSGRYHVCVCTGTHSQPIKYSLIDSFI